MSDIRLVYFDIRGLAEPIRLMLALSEIPFDDERIPLDSWASAKKRNSFDVRGDDYKRKSLDKTQSVERFKSFIGQLPILYFDDIVITQTFAVTRFLARKYGFNGETQVDEARAEEISELVYDLRLRAVDFLNSGFKTKTPDIVRHTVFRDFSKEPDSPGKQKMKDDLRLIHFPLYFTKFASILAQSDGEYIAGNKLTYGDLVLVNFLEIVEELVDPNCLDEFPTLKNLKEKVYGIPKIDRWRKSQEISTVESGYPE